MAYNPDALYGQPVGAPAKLPSASLPLMNEPGQAPRREKVSAALKKLLQLTASIPSSYNDHNLGHFGIAATADEYTAKSTNRPHVPPANPGTGPTLPASTTQEQRDRLYRQYYIDRSHYDLYETVKSWAKQLLLDAIDDEYLAHLKDDILGYQSVTVPEIIKALTDRYLKFNEKQKAALEAPLDTKYAGEPIDLHIAKFNMAFKAFDSASESFTEKQKISKFYRSMQEYSMAKKAIEEWDNDVPTADKTWKKMQTHFRDWYDEKMQNATSASTGFHGANLASFPRDQGSIILTEATETLKTNQALMANLAKKNDEKDTTIANQRADIAALKAELRVLRGRGGAGGTGPRTQQYTAGSGHFQGQGPNLTVNERRALREVMPEGHYCHTHGYSSPHPSHDCPDPGPNHIEVATKYNPQRGSSRRN